MSKKRLIVYGCSFSNGSTNLDPNVRQETVDSKTNYATVAGQKLGYDQIILNGIGAYSNQQISSRIIFDMHQQILEPDDHILIQQTSHWRKTVGDGRFNGVTMDTIDVIDYNNVRYSNDEFLKEILNHRPSLHWYHSFPQYRAWTDSDDFSQDPAVSSKVRKSISEWDLMLTNLCFLATTLSALTIKFPGIKIFVMPFVPLTNASYDKLINDISGHQLLHLLYNEWASSIDTNRCHVLTANPMNYYYNNPKYWDENNIKNFRKIDHGTEEFHSKFADLLCDQMKPFYD